MATQADKKRKDRPTDRATADNSTKASPERPAKRNEADVYDPVGMAGKKAGIVEDMEQRRVEEKDGDRSPKVKP